MAPYSCTSLSPVPCSLRPRIHPLQSKTTGGLTVKRSAQGGERAPPGLNWDRSRKGGFGEFFAAVDQPRSSPASRWWGQSLFSTTYATYGPANPVRAIARPAPLSGAGAGSRDGRVDRTETGNSGTPRPTRHHRTAFGGDGATGRTGRITNWNVTRTEKRPQTTTLKDPKARNPKLPQNRKTRRKRHDLGPGSWEWAWVLGKTTKNNRKAARPCEGRVPCIEP